MAAMIDIGTLRGLLEIVMTRDDTDKFMASVTKAANSTENLNKTLSRAGFGLTELGRGLESAGRVMTASITVPLVAAGVAAVKFASDYEAAMTKVISLSDATEKEVKQLNESVLQLAGQTAQAPTELAKGLFIVESAGIRGAGAMDVMRQASKMATIGMGTMEQTTRSLISAILSYNDGTMNASKAGDLFVRAVQLGNSKMSELIPNLGRVIPMAAMFGISLSQVLASIETFTHLGISVDRATSGLIQIISIISNDTPRAEKGFRALGTSVADFRREVAEKGLAVSLIELVKHAKETNQLEVLHKAFGNIRAFTEVLSNAGPQAENYKRIIDDLERTQGQLARSFDVTTQTFQFRWQQLGVQLQVLAIRFGNTLLPVVERLMNVFEQKFLPVLERIVQLWSQLPPRLQNTVLVFGAMAVALGPFLLVLGQAVLTVGHLYRAMASLRDAGGIFGALRAGFAQLSTPLGMTGLGTGIGNIFAPTLRAVEGLATGIGTAFGVVFARVTPFVLKQVRALILAMQIELSAGLARVGITAETTAAVSAGFTRLGALMTGAVRGIGGLLKTAWIATYGELFAAMTAAFPNVSRVMTTVAASGVATLSASFGTLSAAMGTLVKGLGLLASVATTVGIAFLALKGIQWGAAWVAQFDMVAKAYLMYPKLFGDFTRTPLSEGAADAAIKQRGAIKSMNEFRTAFNDQTKATAAAAENLANYAQELQEQERQSRQALSLTNVEIARRTELVRQQKGLEAERLARAAGLPERQVMIEIQKARDAVRAPDVFYESKFSVGSPVFQRIVDQARSLAAQGQPIKQILQDMIRTTDALTTQGGRAGEPAPWLTQQLTVHEKLQALLKSARAHTFDALSDEAKTAALELFKLGWQLNDVQNELVKAGAIFDSDEAALRKLHQQYQEGVEKAKKLAEANKELVLAAGGYGKILAGMDPLFKAWINKLMEAGAGDEALRTKYNLSEIELKALRMERDEHIKLLKFETGSTEDLISVLDKLGKVDVETIARLKILLSLRERLAEIEGQPTMPRTFTPFKTTGEVFDDLLPNDDSIGRLRNFLKIQDDIEKKFDKWVNSIRHVGQAFASMAQIAGDSMAGLFRWVGRLFTAFDAVLELIKSKGIFGGMGDSAPSIFKPGATFGMPTTRTGRLAFAGAMVGAGVLADLTANARTAASVAIHDAAVGAQIGGMIGGPMGMAVGAAAGLVAGLIKGKPAWAKAADEVARDFGVKISDELAKTIAKDAKEKFGGSRQAAEIFHLSDIIREAGGLNDQNIGRMALRLHDVFVMIGKGQMSIADGAKVIGENWNAMVEAGTSDFGLLASNLADVVRLTKEYGMRIKEVTEYVKQQIDNVFSGFDQFLANSRVKTRETADALASSLLAAIQELQARGMSLTEIFAKIEPWLNKLQLQLKALGFSGGEAFDQLMRAASMLRDPVTGPLLRSIDALGKIMIGLANTASLSPTTFQKLAAEIGKLVDNLISKGKSFDDIMQLVQPQLQVIWELQQRFGIQLDKTTQSLIDQALAAGKIGEKFKSPADRMVTQLEIMNQLLLAIADKFGAKIPEAIRRMIQEMQRANATTGGGGGGGGGDGEGRSGRPGPPRLLLGAGSSVFATVGATTVGTTTRTSAGTQPVQVAIHVDARGALFDDYGVSQLAQRLQQPFWDAVSKNKSGGYTYARGTLQQTS